MKEITNRILKEKEIYANLKQTEDIKDFIDRNFTSRKPNGWAEEYIYGIEIYPDLAMATKVNMVGHGDGSANIFAEDGLIDFANYKDGKLLNIKIKNDVYEILL